MTKDDERISSEQRRFAATIEFGMRCGLALLVPGFMAYVFGWVPAAVPLESLSQYWGLPVAEYRQLTGAPEGWSWLAHLGKGDTLPLIGIVVLCATALFAFIGLIIACLVRRDWPYAVIAALQVMVLVLAASGLFTAH